MTVDLTPARVDQPAYLTVIPARNVRDKAHSTRGRAHAAITYQVEHPYSRGSAYTAAALYEWTGSEWALLWQCQRGDDISGRPWKAATL